MRITSQIDNFIFCLVLGVLPFLLILQSALASAIDPFPYGTEFSKIESVEQRSHAWASCYVLNRAVSQAQNLSSELSEQRFKLSEANRLILMVTLLADETIMTSEHENALAVIWAANRLITERTKELLAVGKKQVEVEGTKSFGASLSSFLTVCESNSFEAVNILSKFKSAMGTLGTKEQILAETLAAARQ